LIDRYVGVTIAYFLFQALVPVDKRLICTDNYLYVKHPVW